MVVVPVAVPLEPDVYNDPAHYHELFGLRRFFGLLSIVVKRHGCCVFYAGTVQRGGQEWAFIYPAYFLHLMRTVFFSKRELGDHSWRLNFPFIFSNKQNIMIFAQNNSTKSYSPVYLEFHWTISKLCLLENSLIRTPNLKFDLKPFSSKTVFRELLLYSF